MKQILTSSSLCLLLALGLILNSAAAESFDDITVNLEPSPGGTHIHGYLEHRFTIVNHSADKSHNLTLRLPEYNYISSHTESIARISRSVNLPPNSQAVLSLYQPPLPLTGHDIQVVIDGKARQQNLSFTPAAFGTNPSDRQPTILLSRRVSGDFITQAEEIFRDENDESSRQGSSPTSVPTPSHLKIASHVLRTRKRNDQLLRAEHPAATWSASWLAYTRYDAVVLTPDDLNTMPTPVSAALNAWVDCGGLLITLGSQKTIPPHADTLGAGIWSESQGFGLRYHIPDDNLDNWPENRWLLLQQHWALNLTPWQHFISLNNDNFPVTDSVGIPLRGSFVLMICFALLIGPVNLIFISKKNRRMHLLWTVPLFSLATCLCIFLYALIAEGWRPTVRADAVTILDENTRRASTLGLLALYSPLTPAQGLMFDPHTELTLQTDVYSRNSSVSNRTIDWTHGQHFATDWLQARLPSHFKIRKNETRRERLPYRQTPDGRLIATNGLGADIESLHLMTDQGQIYHAENIPAGSEAVLQPLPETHLPTQDYRQIYLMFSNPADMVDRIILRPQSYLQPNTYLAALDACPFIEQPLANPKSEIYRTVVLGIMSEEKHAGPR